METEGQNYKGGMDFSEKLSTGNYTKLSIVLCTYHKIYFFKILFMNINGEIKVGKYRESEGIHKRKLRLKMRREFWIKLGMGR